MTPDEARPAWLDMEALRFEKQDSYLSGFGTGLLAGGALAVLVLVLFAVLASGAS